MQRTRVVDLTFCSSANSLESLLSIVNLRVTMSRADTQILYDGYRADKAKITVN